MGKYEPLRNFLNRAKRDRLPMTFREIEEVIGASLPRSARQHRAWWSNNAFNSTMTEAWLEAGFRTERVDIRNERVTFRRSEEVAAQGGEVPPELSIIGCLKGTVQINPDVDLTEPTGETWSAEMGRLHE